MYLFDAAASVDAQTLRSTSWPLWSKRDFIYARGREGELAAASVGRMAIQKSGMSAVGTMASFSE
jgi:hypothetical protein